jgi:hypothetical protein
VTDELELRALVDQAWELRGSPYLRDGVAAIEDWWDRRATRAWERRQRKLAALVQLLRETDPAKAGSSRAA